MLLEIKIEVCCEAPCEAKKELCHGRRSGQNSLCVYYALSYHNYLPYQYKSTIFINIFLNSQNGAMISGWY